MGFEGRQKEKYKVVGKFIEKIKEIQKKAKAALKKAQKEMKQYIDRKRRERDKYRKENLVILSTKDLKQQMKGRIMEKLTKQFIDPYKVKGVVSTNIIELELPLTIKIHPVVNISRV